ncbi:MAG: anaerobic ribonucleoside-triphosphate reductase activating protein [Bacteroidetes bacterium]|nr:anaerobic ribonucleoside-triphosphate reductase activating protein [Bacteroidota bacterium]
MEIGGFIKTSLIDYPGKVAAVVFTQGCNFRCPYCHNRLLWHRTQNTFIEQYIVEYLEQHRHFLDGVVVTGGEPTLQPDLLQFLETIKNLGYLVKLDTNGSYPSVVRRGVDEKLIDYIAMDVKSALVKKYYSEVSGVIMNDTHLTSLQLSIEFIVTSGVEYEFRTTMCRNFVKPDDIIMLCSTTLRECKRLCLQQCRPHTFHRCEPYTQKELSELRNAIPSSIELLIR